MLKDAAKEHLARMVCLPARRPEWVVSVVREDAKGLNAQASYYVEYAGAERKLSSSKDAREVKVARSRAFLDRDTAESLNKTWRRMLRTTRYPNEHRSVRDGVTYHFSRFVAGVNDPLMGFEQGKVVSPYEGSLCSELVAIGEELKMYTLAPPADQDKGREVIRAKLDQLASKLDRLGRDE
jgi:hypothetical protein